MEGRGSSTAFSTRQLVRPFSTGKLRHIAAGEVAPADQSVNIAVQSSDQTRNLPCRSPSAARGPLLSCSLPCYSAHGVTRPTQPNSLNHHRNVHHVWVNVVSRWGSEFGAYLQSRSPKTHVNDILKGLWTKRSSAEHGPNVFTVTRVKEAMALANRTWENVNKMRDVQHSVWWDWRFLLAAEVRQTSEGYHS
jgi:hypothetical protein